MRCAAVAGLLATAACNQVFGIDKADSRDAPEAKKPHDVTVTERWSDALDLNNPTLSTPPISGATYKVAALGKGFTLVPAEADGTIHVPADTFGTDETDAQTWRLQVDRAGSPTIEVQWKPLPAASMANPQASTGHLIVASHFGHTDAKPEDVPPDSGYTITTGVASHAAAHVFTTGIWTDKLLVLQSDPLDVPFGDAGSLLSGRYGLTKPGDFGLAYDFKTYSMSPNMGCVGSVGGASFALPALQANMHDAVSVAWQTTPLLSETYSLPAAAVGRLDPVLGGGSLVARVRYGLINDERMPSFLHQGTTAADLLLPVPVMLTLVDCPAINTDLPAHFEGNLPPGLVPAMHGQAAITRQLSGTTISVASGIEMTARPTGSSFTLDMPISIPSGIALTSAGTTLQLLPTSGSDDPQTLPVGDKPIQLAIAPETGFSADYYEVTVFAEDIDQAEQVLKADHVYFVAFDNAAPVEPTTIEIEPEVFKAGTTYVLRVRALAGFPGAAVGDFTQVKYPQTAAQVYSRPFHR